jgi:hypothetical protein
VPCVSRRANDCEPLSESLRADVVSASSTLARHDVTLRLHLLPPLAKRPIGQITPAEVLALVKRWVGERKPSSVARDYRTLAAIFNYAVEQEFIARSPCRKVKLPPDRHVGAVYSSSTAGADDVGANDGEYQSTSDQAAIRPSASSRCSMVKRLSRLFGRP